MLHDINEQLHVSELAGLGAFARAVLARAVSDAPDVVSLRVVCTIAGAAIEIDCELVDAAGHAIGGFSL